MKYAVLVLLFVSVSVSCSYARSQSRAAVNYAVLAECKDKVFQHLDALKEKKPFHYKYHGIKDKLMSNIDLVGFVSLYSDELQVYELLVLFSELKRSCYPNNSISYEINESNANQFYLLISELRTRGVQGKIRMELDGNRLTLYFFEKDNLVKQ